MLLCNRCRQHISLSVTFICNTLHHPAGSASTLWYGNLPGLGDRASFILCRLWCEGGGGGGRRGGGGERICKVFMRCSSILCMACKQK